MSKRTSATRRTGELPARQPPANRDFSDQIAYLQERVHALELDVAAGTSTPQLWEIARQELLTALEELQVAQEELHSQNLALAEARLQAEAERWRYLELFDGAPDAYVVTDTRGIIREANRMAATVLAWRQDHLVGRPLSQFVPLEERSAFRRQLNRLAGAETVPEWELSLCPHRAGETFPAAITVAAVHDARGQVCGLRWLIRDIRARKALEMDRLLDLVENLPRGVLLVDQQGAILLANALARAYLADIAARDGAGRLQAIGDIPLIALIKASAADTGMREFVLAGPPRRIFEIASRQAAGAWVVVIREATREREIQENLHHLERLRSLSTMAGGISHHLNNILAIIIGHSEHLIDTSSDTLPEQARHTLKKVVQQSFRAADIIHQLAEFGQGADLAQVLLDLGQFLPKLVSHMAAGLADNIQVRLACEPGTYLIYADSNRMMQIVANLVANAQEAMPRGGAITLRLAQVVVKPGQPPPAPGMTLGTWVVLSVSDTGPGIAPEHLPQLFDPFFTTKELGQGTGLGLAQVYGMVHQHCGFIEVASSPGRGATFTIYLPAVQWGQGGSAVLTS